MYKEIIERILKSNLTNVKTMDIEMCSNLLSRYLVMKQKDNMCIKEEVISEMIYAIFGRGVFISDIYDISSEIINSCAVCGYSSLTNSVEEVTDLILAYVLKSKQYINKNQLIKILFLIQGYTLSKHNKLLFNEPIIKGERCGPIIKSVNERFYFMFMDLFNENTILFTKEQKERNMKLSENLPIDIVIEIQGILHWIYKINFAELNSAFVKTSLFSELKAGDYVDYVNMKNFFEIEEGEDLLSGKL